ncbi:tannase/feruloyl esterase family alpha/beta hydrolase [Pseudorhodoferax soli]|uniref:Feruloyl esterase n=1 Tax=Pseudorhodoferax soli TaxID=545864 RepID=A0A368XQ64_9BURK|nr:tannase/feruloyl esterase family alpha/beta hydrolase [Pseudorhodoferax soli]RCW68657.1 feruloyl esterase [Pseudorhodoferax soli]
MPRLSDERDATPRRDAVSCPQRTTNFPKGISSTRCAVLALPLLALSACGGDDSDTVAPIAAACSQAFFTATWAADPSVSVLEVKDYKAGDALPNAAAEVAFNPTLSQTAVADLCFVKLVVGPAHAGPADAPSTSAGVGIEIWLPTKEHWNGRFHGMGSGNWGGGNDSLVGKISETATEAADGTFRSAPRVAGQDGSATSTTDKGHTGATHLSGAFLMNPDGSINTTGWENWSTRGLHLQAVRTKEAIKAYYGSAQKYSYFSGTSGSGRDAMAIVQYLPEDYDGVLAQMAGGNWTKWTTAWLYPQIVYQRDLGGPIAAGKLTSVSKAAIAACDVVGGQHLGYILDQSACRYDPTKDASVLCAADGGSNGTSDCVSQAEARAINKVWYGMTADGSVPDPAVDNGFDTGLAGVRKWYGFNRGTDITGIGFGASLIGADMVALELQNSQFAGPTFKNATGNGAELWKSMSYAELANAFDLGVALQPQFANASAGSPDLSAFKARGGKLIHTSAMNDSAIMPGGQDEYYRQVESMQGSLGATQTFYRLYQVPGQGHAYGSNGTANPDANNPVFGPGELMPRLIAWVENGTAPEGLQLRTTSTTAPVRTMPACAYPAKPTYVGGDVNTASSYACR